MSIETMKKYFERINSVELSEVEYKKLLRFIDGYFIKRKDGGYKKLSADRTGRIVYYPSKGAYHLYNTCNTWIIKGLKESGLDADPAFVVTSDDVYKRISGFSKSLSE